MKTRINRKKSQIKFGETFAIIILVYILIVAGMVWYNNSNSKKISLMQEEDKKDKAFEKYYYIVNSDLLHKSEQGDVDEEFDLISLRVFSTYTVNDVNNEHIRKQIGESTVKLEIVNRDFESVENFTLYYKTPNKINGQEGFKTLIPVYDSVNKETYIGKLTVITYS